MYSLVRIAENLSLRRGFPGFAKAPLKLCTRTVIISPSIKNQYNFHDDLLLYCREL